jgi:hypothetical protein
MAIPFLNNINLSNNEVQNVKLHNTSTISATSSNLGQIYFDTDSGDKRVKVNSDYASAGSYVMEPLAFETWVTANFADGTVTSVGLSMPSAFTVTNSPVTTSGTLNVTGSGSVTDYIDGTGAIQAFPTLDNYQSWGLSGDTGVNHTISSGDVVEISGGTDISTQVSPSPVDTIKIHHSLITRTDTTSTDSGNSHGDSFAVVDSITSSSTGHITAVNVKTVSFPASDNTDTIYNLSVQAGGANTSVIRLADSHSSNDDVTISGTLTTVKVTENTGTDTIILDLQDDVTIVNDLTVGGDINVTGSLNSFTTSELLVQDQYVTLNSGQTTPVLDAFLKVERGTTDVAVKWNEATDRWQFTNDGTTYYNIPISTEYNNYVHPTHPGDDIDVDTGPLTGAVVVSDIDINITTDTLGHVTDANGVISTRTLTLADLGYTGATNADNYGSWTIQDGDATTYPITSGDTLQIASGTGIVSNFTADDVLTISHSDTSTQASVNNSGRTYIQDITLDDFGHITAIASATETVTDTQLATAAALVDVSAMGVNTTASFTHGLASKNLIVQMYDVVTGEVVFADIDHTSINAISVSFSVTPTNDIRVVVIDAKNGLTDKTVSYS